MQVAHTTYGIHSVTEPSFTAALLQATISISAFPAWRLLDKHDQACAAEVLRDLGWLSSRPFGEKLRYGGYSPWLRGAQALGRAVGSIA